MTDAPRDSGLALSEARGPYGERVGDDALRFQRHFAAGPERVWKAIVTPEGLAAWLGRTGTIDARAGGVFEIHFNDEDSMLGRILEFERHRRLVLAWRESLGDESVVSFELEPAVGGGTEFVFTHRYARAGEHMLGLGAGWHAHFDALAAMLEGRDSPDRAASYERLLPDYERRFSRYVTSVDRS